MMLLILVIGNILFNWYDNAYEMNCTEYQCQNSYINCPPRENCFVSCPDTQSCIKSIINCPVSGDCNIECLGSESCKDIVVDATLLSGNFNINCGKYSETTSHCSNMKIYGNTLQSNNHGSFNIQCLGIYKSCINSEIVCPIGGYCNVLCNGDTSCEYSQITGLINSNINIHCNSIRSCFGGIFNGAQSSKLNITGCTSHKSCLDVSIYCPPYSNGHKNCFVEGNDNLGQNKASKSPSISPTIAPTLNPTINTNSPSKIPTNTPTYKPSLLPNEYPGEGIKIYAINGWKDIDIKYSGNYSDTHDGMMNCGNNYHISCDIAKNDWTCDDLYQCNDNYQPINTINTNQNISKNNIINYNVTVNKINNNYSNYNNITNTIEPIINTDTHTNILYKTRLNGDIFILSGIGLVIFTCLCVGCAQIRKNIHDLKRETKQGVPSNSHHSPEEWKLSVSRSHHSSRSHRDLSRGSRSRSHYDHPIEQSK